jgi:hypothetical protein
MLFAILFYEQFKTIFSIPVFLVSAHAKCREDDHG